MQSGNLLSSGDYALPVGKGDQERLNIQSKICSDLLHRTLEKWKKKGLIEESFEGKTILDFGCGVGSARESLEKNFPGVTYQGIDNSAEQVKVARVAHPGVSFYAGNETTQKGWALIGEADFIFMRFVVMHQKNPGSFLKEVISHMKPGARIIVFEPFTKTLPEHENVSKALSDALVFGRKLKLDLGTAIGLDYNFAPKIYGVFKEEDLESVFEEKISKQLFPLKELRALLVQSIDSMGPKVLELGLTSEEDMNSSKKNLMDASDLENVALSDVFIVMGRKPLKSGVSKSSHKPEITTH